MLPAPETNTSTGLSNAMDHDPNNTHLLKAFRNTDVPRVDFQLSMQMVDDAISFRFSCWRREILRAGLLFLGHENMMWGRKLRPSSNPLYQRLCNPTKAGDIQSFLYHINSHCTINSLRRILRPFDHILLNGVVLPSYIQLGNEAVHELTVGNARNTVLYYLSDALDGSRGVAPEPTMGRDLEALLCMLLGIPTLQSIDSGRMERDFVVEVIKTKNAIDPLLFTALGSNLSATAYPRISGARIHNTTKGKNSVSYKQSETPTAGYVFNANPLKAINVPKTSKAAIAHINHIQQATGLAPQNRLAMTGPTSLAKNNYLPASSSGLKLTTSGPSSQQTALPTPPSETERHVSDLLLKTIDLGIKQSLIETQEKQLNACKDSIKQLADVCTSLLQNSKTSGVVNEILQEVMIKLVSAGVVCSDISVMGNEDQSHTPSIPGPIRRTVRSTLQPQSRTRGEYETCAGPGTPALVATRYKKSTETSRVTPYPAVLAGTIDARNLLLAKIQQKVRTRQKKIRKGKNVVGNQQAINSLEKTIRSLQTMIVLTPQQAANVNREVQEMGLVKEVYDGREVELAEYVNVKKGKTAKNDRDSRSGVSQVATTVNGMVATENNGDYEDKGRSSNSQVNLKGSQFAFNLPIPGMGMMEESLPPSVVMQTYVPGASAMFQFPPILPLSPPPQSLNSRGTEINNSIFTSAPPSFMKDYGNPCSKTRQLGWSKDCPIFIDEEGEQSQN